MPPLRRNTQDRREERHVTKQQKRTPPAPVPYKYLATTPDLPPDATSPFMDSRMMTDWLNNMAEDGWEFAGYGQKQWNLRSPQEWWIFRRPLPQPTEQPDERSGAAAS